MISITNPVLNSWIIFAVLAFFLVLTIKKRKESSFFPVNATTEIKGLAIIAIIIAHIGYLLVQNPEFLTPLSYFAGVGVDIFLFVSGYGLTASAMRKKSSILQFYQRRLAKLFLPFWLIISVLYILDYFVLHRTYPLEYIYKSFLGIFKTASIYQDVNSPLWYFTFIVFYYLIYPLVFIRKYPWISALAILIISYLILRKTSVADIDNAGFYELHTWAFPTGMVFAWLTSKRDLASKYTAQVKTRLPIFWHKNSKLLLNYLAVIGLLVLIVISRKVSTPYDSPQKEQLINVLTTIDFVLLFSLKRYDFKLLQLFGIYSYEIYLVHVPLLTRYDLFFPKSIGWLAVILFLALSLLVGKILHYFTAAIFSKIASTN